MINIKKYSVKKTCLLFMSLLLISCEDFLDREPLDQISQTTFWKRASDLDAYIIGKYPWLPGGLEGVGFLGYFHADYLSDNMLRGSGMGGFDGYMNGEKITPTKAGEGGWSWGAIREINMFFDNYQKCEEPFESYQQSFGEACFLKAYKYHELVRQFGDIPWYSSVIESDDAEALMKPRDPREMVVDSIMNLIDNSIEYLKTRDEVGVNRLNKESALIFKSRVALYEATWSKYHVGTPSASKVDANKYFNEVVKAYEQLKSLSNNYSGMVYSTGSPDEDYFNLFNKNDYSGIKEVTLSKSYSDKLDVWSGVIYWVSEGYGNFGYTLELVQSYLDRSGKTIDVTDRSQFPASGTQSLTDYKLKLDPRFAQSCFAPGDPVNQDPGWKDSTWTIPALYAMGGYAPSTGFQPQKGNNPNTGSQRGNSECVSGIGFRVAEIMLNYVEAYVELNGSFPDLSNNIDLLRARVGMPSLTGHLPIVDKTWPDYGYPISDELAIARQERRVELAGEGYRPDDWKRWRAHALFVQKRPKGYLFSQADFDKIDQKPEMMVDNNGFLDPYQKSLPKGFQFRPDKDYLQPIPLEDLLRNENLKQNPGWDKP